MTKYRIVRKNSMFGWTYTIQRLWFGKLWLKTSEQAYNEFDLERAQEKVQGWLEREQDAKKRKADVQNLVVQSFN